MRRPEQYTVGEILRLTEDTLAPVACLSGEENACVRAGACKTLPMWEKLREIVTDYLDSVTLDMLVGQPEPGGDYVI